MSAGPWVWRLSRVLQGGGLLVVLVGLLISVDTGMRDDSLTSQRAELMGLMVGGGMFISGWLLGKAGSGK